ncbi:large ribosomal subunit protein uL29m isoform X2 [Halyomorpha halys]
MEFFDSEENWSLSEVKVGRSWKKEELRIKSNEDLHKLWYVLLKEKNMLLTMEHEYKECYEAFPSPERIDKVKESMVNLEDIIRERNKAYWLLETGQTGERPGKPVYNQLGLRTFYKMREHILPKDMNRSWWKKHKQWYNFRECDRFLSLYREKLFLEKRKARNRDKNHVLGLLKRFPDMDISILKEQYPHLNIDRLKLNRKADPHFIPS